MWQSTFTAICSNYRTPETLWTQCLCKLCIPPTRNNEFWICLWELHFSWICLDWVLRTEKWIQLDPVWDPLNSSWMAPTQKGFYANAFYNCWIKFFLFIYLFFYLNHLYDISVQTTMLWFLLFTKLCPEALCVSANPYFQEATDCLSGLYRRK